MADETSEERIRRRLHEESGGLNPTTGKPGHGGLARVLAEEFALLDKRYMPRPKTCRVCHHDAVWNGSSFVCVWIGCPNEGAPVE